MGFIQQKMLFNLSLSANGMIFCTVEMGAKPVILLSLLHKYQIWLSLPLICLLTDYGRPCLETNVVVPQNFFE